MEDCLDIGVLGENTFEAVNSSISSSSISETSNNASDFFEAGIDSEDEEANKFK